MHFASKTSKYAKLAEGEPALTPRKRIMHFVKHPFFGCRMPKYTHTEYVHTKYAKLMYSEPLTYFEPLTDFEPTPAPRVRSVVVQQYNF